MSKLPVAEAEYPEPVQLDERGWFSNFSGQFSQRVINGPFKDEFWADHALGVEMDPAKQYRMTIRIYEIES